MFTYIVCSGCSFWQPVQADSQPKSSGLVLGRRPLGAKRYDSVIVVKNIDVRIKNIKKHVLYSIIKNIKKTFVKKHFPYST